MKLIPVGPEHYAMVDDEDYEWMSESTWEPHVSKAGKTTYARRRETPSRMHKLITGFDQTDHVNGNGLDNRRENLRAATDSQNKANRGKHSGDHTSQYKGVDWHKPSGSWRARITHNKKEIRLGHFESEVEAARAYDEAAIIHFGDFAHLNFQDE